MYIRVYSAQRKKIFFFSHTHTYINDIPITHSTWISRFYFLLQKVVFLQNVSTSLARFQLVPRPRNSRFTVMVDYKEERPGIPPGMRVKLIISFRCDVLDEPEETLIVNVQQGRPVIIKLRGYRDPPILRGKRIFQLSLTKRTRQAQDENDETSQTRECNYYSHRHLQCLTSRTFNIHEKNRAQEKEKRSWLRKFHLNTRTLARRYVSYPFGNNVLNNE